MSPLKHVDWPTEVPNGFTFPYTFSHSVVDFNSDTITSLYRVEWDSRLTKFGPVPISSLDEATVKQLRAHHLELLFAQQAPSGQSQGSSGGMQSGFGQTVFNGADEAQSPEDFLEAINATIAELQREAHGVNIPIDTLNDAYYVQQPNTSGGVYNANAYLYANDASASLGGHSGVGHGSQFHYDPEAIQSHEFAPVAVPEVFGDEDDDEDEQMDHSPTTELGSQVPSPWNNQASSSSSSSSPASFSSGGASNSTSTSSSSGPTRIRNVVLHQSEDWSITCPWEGTCHQQVPMNRFKAHLVAHVVEAQDPQGTGRKAHSNLGPVRCGVPLLSGARCTKEVKSVVSLMRHLLGGKNADGRPHFLPRGRMRLAGGGWGEERDLPRQGCGRCDFKMKSVYVGGNLQALTRHNTRGCPGVVRSGGSGTVEGRFGSAAVSVAQDVGVAGPTEHGVESAGPAYSMGGGMSLPATSCL